MCLNYSCDMLICGRGCLVCLNYSCDMLICGGGGGGGVFGVPKLFM